MPPRPAKRAATPGQYRDLTGAVPLLPRPAKRAATPGQYRDLTGAVPLLT